MGEVAQVIFRPSSEIRGYYRFHYGFLPSEGPFSECAELSFWQFLSTIDVPAAFVTSLEAKLGAAELEICGFGYLSQERFNDFLRYLADSSDSVQLCPGMLVLTFLKKKMKANDLTYRRRKSSKRKNGPRVVVRPLLGHVL